jgi:O-antigen/teichoic acid export membrane protein
MFALTFAIGFILLRDFVRNICFSHLNFVAAFLLDTGIGIVQISGLLFLAHIGWLSAQSSFLVIGLACGIAVVIWFYRSKELVVVEVAEIVPTFQRNWQFGRWIFGSGLLWEAGLSLYPWILTFYHGTSATGVWAACFGVVALGNPLLLGMQNYLGPRIAHAYAESEAIAMRRFVMRSSLFFTIATLPIAVVIATAGNILVILVYGEKYAGHGSVMLILAIGLLLAPVRFVLARSLFAMDRALMECLTNLVPLAVLVLLGVWLVKSFSVVGVASGLLLGDLLVTVTKYVVFELSLKTVESRVDEPVGS